MSKIEVEYIDHLGTDLTVVNAAKVSFDKESKWILEKLGIDLEPTKKLSDGDKRLIQFLARGCTQDEWNGYKKDLIDFVIDYHYNHQDKNIVYAKIEEILKNVKYNPTHFTPFTHEYITLRETVPIFVRSQRFKHVVGFSYNEISRRYVDSKPEFFVPDTWRGRAANKKQGSDYDRTITVMKTLFLQKDQDDKAQGVQESYNIHIKNSIDLYENMIDSGIAPEQARMVLPQSMMTSYYVTGSLYAFSRAYNQRHDRNHAQGEIADLADKWNEIIKPLFPVSWQALTNQ